MKVDMKQLHPATRGYFSVWFLFLLFSTKTEAKESCCEAGQTLESDSYCVSQSSQVPTKTFLHDRCQGRLQQMEVGQFVRTKFGGLYQS